MPLGRTRTCDRRFRKPLLQPGGSTQVLRPRSPVYRDLSQLASPSSETRRLAVDGTFCAGTTVPGAGGPRQREPAEVAHGGGKLGVRVDRVAVCARSRKPRALSPRFRARRRKECANGSSTRLCADDAKLAYGESPERYPLRRRSSSRLGLASRPATSSPLAKSTESDVCAIATSAGQ